MYACEWHHSPCMKPILPTDSPYRVGRLEGGGNYCLEHLDLRNFQIRHEAWFGDDESKRKGVKILGKPSRRCPCPFCTGYWRVRREDRGPTIMQCVREPERAPALPNDYPLTPDAYQKRFGKRFRVTAEQSERIKSGEITIQEAYDAFRSLQPDAVEYDRVAEIRKEVAKNNSELLPINRFAYRRKLGKKFCRTQDQKDRGLSLDQAYEEFCKEKDGLIHRTPGFDGDVPETREAYKEKYGKRFRMTKEQSERGLSSDEAFAEWQKRHS